MQKLLNSGADVNARDADNYAPLVLAVNIPCVRAALSIVHGLLRKGANPNVRWRGGTVLHHALDGLAFAAHHRLTVKVASGTRFSLAARPYHERSSWRFRGRCADPTRMLGRRGSATSVAECRAQCAATPSCVAFDVNAYGVAVYESAPAQNLGDHDCRLYNETVRSSQDAGALYDCFGVEETVRAPPLGAEWTVPCPLARNPSGPR